MHAVQALVRTLFPLVCDQKSRCLLKRILQSHKPARQDKSRQDKTSSAVNTKKMHCRQLTFGCPLDCYRITAKEVHARSHAGAYSRLPNWPHAAISSSPLLSLMVHTLRACRHTDFIVAQVPSQICTSWVTEAHSQQLARSSATS